MMRQMFYHCATAVAQNCFNIPINNNLIFCFFFFYCQRLFSKAGARSSNCTRTLNRGMMRQVFYRCATAAALSQLNICMNNNRIFCYFFTHSKVPKAATVLEPSTVVCLDKCSTTALLLLLYINSIFVSITRRIFAIYFYIDSNYFQLRVPEAATELKPSTIG